MGEPEVEPALKRLLEDSEDPELERSVFTEESIEEESKHPGDGTKSATKPAATWPEVGVMSISVIQQAFFAHQPRNPGDYLFTRDLIHCAEDTQRRQATEEKKTDGPEETRGMPDALYALYFDWELQKRAQGASYRHSDEFKVRVCGLRGEGDEFTEELSTWIGKKKGKLGCRLQKVLSPEGVSLYYLEKDGRPLVSNGMLRALMKACHAATRCRATKLLKKDFLERFSVLRYSTDLVSDAAKDLKCEVCDGTRPLPKKQHVESIFTYAPFHRLQIDAVQIASSKLKRFRGKHGYRYLLALIDCFTKNAWVWPLKTLNIPETLAILEKFFEDEFVPDILQSDNGPQFKNKLLEAVCTELHFKQRYGASETPQHQGQVERFNKTFKTNLFRWVQNVKEPIACEEWPTTGIKKVLQDYRSTEHSTIKMSPDMFVFGTMRTPDAREAHKTLTKSLVALIEDQTAHNLTHNLTSNMQQHVDNTLAKCVWAYLELRDSNLRKAMSQTEKTQIANRMRRSGMRISAKILPQIGQSVWMRRPQKRSHNHVAKDPTQPSNVKGVIVGVSLVAASFKVQWTEDNKLKEVWTGAHGLVFADTVCLPRRPKSLTTEDLGVHMKDFINDLQSWWRNTRLVIEEARRNNDEICERTVEDLLESLGVDELEGLMTKAQQAEQIVVAVLDEKFVRYLRTCEPSMQGMQSVLHDDTFDELILAHAIKSLGCKELMAAAGRWREDRLQNPAVFLPKVLTALSGEPHQCAECVLSDQCQPEHACCRELLSKRMQDMGWASTQVLAGLHV
jgi:transposase InsO family protein